MSTYELTIILQGSPELTEEVADRLFDAGCDDGSPGTCDGVFSIDFHREGRILESAIGSAIADVKSAGFDIERIEIKTGACPSRRNVASTLRVLKANAPATRANVRPCRTFFFNLPPDYGTRSVPATGWPKIASATERNATERRVGLFVGLSLRERISARGASRLH